MKTFDYKRKIYLIIFIALVYNIYQYQLEEDQQSHCPHKTEFAEFLSEKDDLVYPDSYSKVGL